MLIQFHADSSLGRHVPLKADTIEHKGRLILIWRVLGGGSVEGFALDAEHILKGHTDYPDVDAVYARNLVVAELTVFHGVLPQNAKGYSGVRPVKQKAT